MHPRQRYVFLNRYRLLRSLVIGTILTSVLYVPLTGKEALSIGMLTALLVDAVLSLQIPRMLSPPVSSRNSSSSSSNNNQQQQQLLQLMMM